MRASSIAAFFCSFLVICGSGESRADVRMAEGVLWEEVLWTAERAKFDYRERMNAAAAGDEAAVRELFLFSRHTDAAAGLGHGVALVDLFQTIGEEMPARVAKTLNSEDKKQLVRRIEAGVSYGLRAAPEDWPKLYPGMAAALGYSGFSVTWLLVLGVFVAFGVLMVVHRRSKLRHAENG